MEAMKLSLGAYCFADKGNNLYNFNVLLMNTKYIPNIFTHKLLLCNYILKSTF